jgi:hypothetical protein
LTTVSGVENRLLLTDGETRSTCLNVSTTGTTDISVMEETNQIGGFTFTSTRTGDCEITDAIPGQNYQCTLINTIGTGGGNGLDIVGAQADTTDVESPPGIVGGLVAQAQAEGSTPAQPTDVLDPPFKRCEDNLAELGEVGVSAQDRVLRAASSMKIVIDGKVNLEKVKDALNKFNTDVFQLALINDLKRDDHILSTVSGPAYTGSIIIKDSKGLEQKIIDYNILDVRRECSYITLAEAAGPATNANVFPLGLIGSAKRTDLDLSDVDKLLIGGRIVSGGTPNKPVFLNPPVAVCNPPPQSGTNPLNNNFAIYNLKGTIDRHSKALDEGDNNLLMYWTFDLIQDDQDHAKIVDNNNPIAKVDLLTKEQKNKYGQIDFSLTDLWTDCKQIALDNDMMLNFAANEFNP